MNLPVRSTLPLNTLSPMALAHKFQYHHPGGFAGLGGQVCVTDESGQDYCYDDGTADTVNTIIPIQPVPTVESPLPTTLDLSNYPTQTSTYPSGISGSYMNSDGSVIMLKQGGGWIQINPNGSTVQTYSGVPYGAASTSIPASVQQAQAYATIINALTNAGVRLEAVTNLPAGATLLPNGTIVGAGQSFSSGGVNATLAALFKSPVLLMVGAVVVLMAMER